MAKETKPHTPEPQHAQTAPQADETILVTPKGASKARFVMTFLLVIMLLTTFSISDEVVACFGGGRGANVAAMSWTDPSTGKKQMRSADFLSQKQQIAKFMAIMMGRNSRDRDDDETAKFLLMSDLSEQAGVRVTDAELKDWIHKRFGTSDNYKQSLQHQRMTAKEFEDIFRRFLRNERYEALLAQGLATPDPAAVEKMWQGRHQEFAFDYIELPAASLAAEAQASAPKGDELKAWFDALPDQDKEKYKSPAIASAELVALSLDGDAKTDKLFAAYPRPADENADDAARDFYSGFGYARYRKTNIKPEEIKKIEDLNEPFEAVKDIAKRDALAYRSLTTWQADLAEREKKGEAIDLAAEAQKLGLAYHRDDKPETQADWAKRDGAWSGQYATDAVFAATAGKLLPAIVVERKAFVFGRVLAKEDAKFPPFAEMESKVRDQWAQKKGGELAVAKLETLRDKFGARPDAADPNAAPFKPEADAEKFAAVAKEAGYEVKHRDFEEHYERIAPDKMIPAETYLRNASQLYVLKEGSIDKAAASTDGSTAYLVRVAGVRDPNPAKMSPAEYQSITKQLGDQAVANFRTSTLSSTDFLKERYGLDLDAWHREKKNANAN
jgi:hypothetical protein